MKAILYTDGGSRGNPGHSAIGTLLFDEGGKLLDFAAEYIGIMTNNQAEYKALILGLELGIKHGVSEVVCYLDSELVVKQLNGLYKIKDEGIKTASAIIEKLKANYKTVEFFHVMREHNKFADKLVNLTLDARAS
jgi:ribonuclease HI